MDIHKAMSWLLVLLCELSLLVSLEAGDFQVIPGTNKKIVIVERKTTAMPAPSYKGPDVMPIVEMVGQKTAELGDLLKSINSSSAAPPDFSFLKQHIDDITKALTKRTTHAQIPTPPIPPPPKLDLSDLAKGMQGFADDLAQAAKDASGSSLADQLKDWLAGVGKSLMEPEPLHPPPQSLRKDMIDDLKGWMDDLKNALNSLINKPLNKGPDTLGMLGNLTGEVNSMLGGIHAAIVEKVETPPAVPQVVPAPYMPGPMPYYGAGVGPAGGGYVGYPPPYYSGEGALPPSFRAYPRRSQSEMLLSSGQDQNAPPGMVGYNTLARPAQDLEIGSPASGQPNSQFGMSQHDGGSSSSQFSTGAPPSTEMLMERDAPSFPGPPDMPLAGEPPPAAPELDKLYNMVMGH